MNERAVQFREGQSVWVIEHNNRVREVTLVRSADGFALVRFPRGGMANLRESRLYPDRESAISHLPAAVQARSRRGFYTKYDYSETWR
ncbi:MAG: hypothetical protein ACOX8B_00820 [Lachnospiraceae bacterium]